jgi:DNA-binding transcriptional LysR family regulator
VLLVERGSRFRGFTEAGERTLDYARKIVGDVRALRQEVAALRSALHGVLRLAAIPTALPMLPALTEPFAAHHPDVRLHILSRTSHDVLGMLENLEVDAGVTYLDNEKLPRVVSVPLYRESYCFVGPADGPFGGRATVAWAELAGQKLALLTPDMQNRRIIDRAFSEAGILPVVAVESDSMTALLAHLRTGRWSSILPSHWHRVLALPEGLSAISLSDPDVSATVGLVVPHREPLPVLSAALVAEAKRLGAA